MLDPFFYDTGSVLTILDPFCAGLSRKTTGQFLRTASARKRQSPGKSENRDLLLPQYRLYCWLWPEMIDSNNLNPSGGVMMNPNRDEAPFIELLLPEWSGNLLIVYPTLAKVKFSVFRSRPARDVMRSASDVSKDPARYCRGRVIAKYGARRALCLLSAIRALQRRTFNDRLIGEKCLRAFEASRAGFGVSKFFVCSQCWQSAPARRALPRTDDNDCCGARIYWLCYCAEWGGMLQRWPKQYVRASLAQCRARELFLCGPRNWLKRNINVCFQNKITVRHWLATNGIIISVNHCL